MDDAKTALVLAHLTDPRLREIYLDRSRRGWTPLMQAVMDGNAAGVARAIADGADIDAIAEGADSALALACAAGSEALVAMLLAAGADPTVRSRRDRSALHLAARHDCAGLVRQLLDAGAQLVADADGDCPLAVAIEHEHAAVLQLLSEQALPPGEPQRAFGFACGRGRLAAMRHLWERFGPVVLTGSPAPLVHAARGGHPTAIHYLVELGAAVGDFDLKEELSPLMHAASARQCEAARALLACGADPNASTEWFVTALRIAEAAKDGPMIELLRAHGATSTDRPVLLVQMPWSYPTADPLHAAVARDDVAAVTSLGPDEFSGALSEAASHGATHCLAYLLARGASPHVAEPSALLRAIRAGDTRAVRLMLSAGPAVLDVTITLAATGQSDPWILADVLDHGAPVDTPTHWRRPLELAAIEGRARHAALLVARGAPVGEGPVITAASRGHLRCVEVLVDHETGARDRALLAAAAHPHVVEALVRRGADPEALDRDGDSLLHRGASCAGVAIDLHLRLASRHLATHGRLGWTPLHNAAMMGSARTIEALIAAGAEVDARDSSGRTPLHLACTYPRPAIVEALLAVGAALDLADDDGASPLHEAACVAPEPVALLLAAGADRAARDRDGRTAVERAATRIDTGDYRTRDRRRRALEVLRAYRAGS